MAVLNSKMQCIASCFHVSKLQKVEEDTLESNASPSGCRVGSESTW